MEESALPTQKAKRAGWKKFKREPEKATIKGLTPITLEIIRILHEYRFVPTSLLLHLVKAKLGTHPRTTSYHLTSLFRSGLANRFAFLKFRFHDEFIYYLDNINALKLYAQATGAAISHNDFSTLRYNRESEYFKINDAAEANSRAGRMLFLQHELAISRFHATLELACQKKCIHLANWQQGPSICHKIWVPKLKMEEGELVETEATERLPHEPDAFFTLCFPNAPAEENTSHFFFELDRGTDTKRLNLLKKFRAHFHYIVKQKLVREHYGVGRIRAVLVQSPTTKRAEQLRQLVGDPLVCGKAPSPLFWFTHAGYFDKLLDIDDLDNPKAKPLPTYLARPEVIFTPIWASNLAQSKSDFDSLLH